jgi:hypothetical protein
MLHRKQSRNQAVLPIGVALLCALGISACGGPEGGTTTPVATPQGTVELEKVKVGMPESTFRDAVITFVPDPNGSSGGKSQYLSRSSDANGGQYVIQCKDGQSYKITVSLNPAVPKEKGVSIMQSLMPAEAPAATKVASRTDKTPNGEYQVESHQLGDNYAGEVVSPDKGATVVMVNAYYIPAMTGDKKATPTAAK